MWSTAFKRRSEDRSRDDSVLHRSFADITDFNYSSNAFVGGQTASGGVSHEMLVQTTMGRRGNAHRTQSL